METLQQRRLGVESSLFLSVLVRSNSISTISMKTYWLVWNNHLTDAPDAIKLGLAAAESLPAVFYQPWLCWRSLNRLRTGIDRAKTTMRRWGTLTTRSQSTATVADHKPGPTSSTAGYSMSPAPPTTSSLSQSGQRRLCEGHDRITEPSVRAHTHYGTS